MMGRFLANHIMAFSHATRASIGYGDGHAGCYSFSEVLNNGESEKDTYTKDWKSWEAMLPDRRY